MITDLAEESRPHKAYRHVNSRTRMRSTFISDIRVIRGRYVSNPAL